jgi:ribosomal protein S18 acetylase RimI-like enzyme
MDEIRIVPTSDEHVESLNRCLDTVARERRYLGLLHVPPLEASRGFLHHILEAGGVSLVAVDGADAVVGWCDVQRRMQEGFEHGGTLGVGMLPDVRGTGLGRRLMTAAIDAARAKGMERIGLEVFASNSRAIALYESLGFVREGLKRRVRKIDGRYDDDVVMALLLGEAADHAQV